MLIRHKYLFLNFVKDTSRGIFNNALIKAHFTISIKIGGAKMERAIKDIEKELLFKEQRVSFWETNHRIATDYDLIDSNKEVII